MSISEDSKNDLLETGKYAERGVLFLSGFANVWLRIQSSNAFWVGLLWNENKFERQRMHLRSIVPCNRNIETWWKRRKRHDFRGEQTGDHYLHLKGCFDLVCLPGSPVKGGLGCIVFCSESHNFTLRLGTISFQYFNIWCTQGKRREIEKACFAKMATKNVVFKGNYFWTSNWNFMSTWCSSERRREPQFRSGVGEKLQETGARACFHGCFTIEYWSAQRMKRFAFDIKGLTRQGIGSLLIPLKTLDKLN